VAIPTEFLQFAGSLLAILLIAWLVKRLGLGSAPNLADDAGAALAASEVVDGFTAVEITRDRAGKGALLRNAAGEIMLIKPHGSHFTGRVLSADASAMVAGHEIIITTGELRFGSVRLEIENATSWARLIDAIQDRDNA